MAKRSRREADIDSLSFRELSVRGTTMDVEGRSIEAVVATETAVPMPDWQRMEMVPEVLLMRGAEFPKSRQVPLLDAHARYSIENQLGSVREISVDGQDMIGRLHFSSVAEEQFTKVREGHLTDVSVGYEVLKRTYIPDGQTKSMGGREYAGPMNLVTKWRVREVSVTPIGADRLAKMRGLSPHVFNPDLKGFVMNEKLRAMLVERGMPADLTDDQAQDWAVENRSKIGDPPKTDENPIPINTEAMRKAIEDAAARAAAKAIDDERKRRDAVRSESDALCGLAGLTSEFARTLYDLPDVAAVRKSIEDEKAKQREPGDVPPAIRITGEGRTRFVSDLGTALTMRAVSANCFNQATIDKVCPVADRGKGYQSFRHATLLDMAREWVQMHGVEVRELTREQIAICAMFGPERAGIRSAAYHTTGSFANLTLDAVNKSMQVGYTEAPSTWEQCFRQGTSVPDFKTINRVRMGSIPNLPIWPDNHDSETASFADAKEVYAVESRSLDTSFSYRLIVNDDMDGLSRAPAMLGGAARRTVNAVAWAPITSNPTMSDGIALFATATGARKRTNLTTGAGAPSVSTLQTVGNLMRQMRGENTPEGNESDDILALRPAVIAGPTALETTINQLVNSAYDPAANSFQVFNPTRTLTPVIEPLLDAASTTAWYLFASPAQIDTVEVTFLQGQESPVVRSWMCDRTLAMHYTVLQTYAAKALNHRGVQKHAGA